MLRLVAAIQNENPVFRTYYVLSIATGCRRGELAALRWTDFDVETGMLCIARSRAQVTGLGIVEGKTKNGKARYVPLENTVRLMLLQLLVLHLGADYTLTANDHIFSDFHGKTYHPDTFSKHFRKLLNENGFDRRYHLHTLRHFLASFLLSDGISNKVVADLLGHRDTSFLEKTYGHPLLEYGAEASQCISFFLSEHGPKELMQLIKRPAGLPATSENAS